MSNVRFFFLYRYLLENTCEGHTAKGEDIRAQYENHLVLTSALSIGTSTN